ncbi:MAG TPA: YbhB/YbcL family Raf kinase inhibitor-like protein [Chitinophagaceae bacterium]|jgi:Raf kinase inhibitor-like YbhB/YbcL family protein|nr:YbhB/YbcL family Raf kinase inhibitor-like protein [Chitinophagaceae bacterium]
MEHSLFTTAAILVLQVSSPAFMNNGDIPVKYSCQGDNISPALSVRNIPAGAISLALIVEDPDAPNGTVTHWVAWDLDPAGIIPEKNTSGTQGKNTKGNNGYMGPCPPDGTHHYHFKVYALDTKINLPEGSTKEQLIAAIKDHTLGEGELIGLYKKTK